MAVVLGWVNVGRTQDLVAAGLTARLASLLNDGYTPVTSPEELNIAIEKGVIND